MVSSTLKAILVLAGMVIPFVGGSRSAVASSPSKVLVLEGTVDSITQISDERRPWLVTVNVKRVVSGEFSGSTFRFAVHSPAQSGLEKGRPYTVKAAWNHGASSSGAEASAPKRAPLGRRRLTWRCSGRSAFLASLGWRLAAECQVVRQIYVG